MKNILVALDLEKNHRVLIDTASELAQKMEATIWLLYVVAPEPDYVGYEVGPQYIRNDLAKEIRKEHRMLQEYAEELRAKHIHAESILLSGATAEMIATEAVKLHADLVVIGHHHRNWLYDLFVENTEAAVLHQIKVPLLVVPIN